MSDGTSERGEAESVVAGSQAVGSGVEGSGVEGSGVEGSDGSDRSEVEGAGELAPSGEAVEVPVVVAPVDLAPGAAASVAPAAVAPVADPSSKRAAISRQLIGASVAIVVCALAASLLIRCGGGTDLADGVDGTESAGSGEDASVAGASAAAPSFTAPNSTVVASTTTTPPTSTTWVPRDPAVTMSLGSVGRKVLLTFDAGSDVGFTDEILATLAQHEIIAGFGVTGQFTEKHPDVVARIVEAGHRLINHSWDHSSATGFSSNRRPQGAEERQRQIDLTEDAIFAATGLQGRPYYRAPFGDMDDAMLAQLGENGFTTYVRWSVDSLGWKGLNAEQIAERSFEKVEPGAVFLFHVGEQSADAAALPLIIDGLIERGYGFATLPEMADSI